MKSKLFYGLLVALLVPVFSMNAMAKRAAPTDVDPIERDGIVYSAPHDHPGAIVATKDGQMLWVRQVYVIRYNPDLERDVQDCFITSMELKDGKIIVKNEKGYEYELDTGSLEVRVVSGSLVVQWE